MTSRSNVLIFGGSGQDGVLLANFLINKPTNNNLSLTLTTTSSSEAHLYRLTHLGIRDKVSVRQYRMEVDDPTPIILDCNPDYCYIICGYTNTASSIGQISSTSLSNVYGFSRILEALKDVSPETSIFVAGSSEMYGSGPSSDIPVTSTHNNSCFPTNPYGITKLYQYHLVQQFREFYKLDISFGVLFNHESELRGRQFVTKKITSNLVRYKLFSGHSFSVGNLSSARDWSSAKDFVRGFSLITEKRSNNNYIFASGHTTSVRTVLLSTAEQLNLRCHLEGIGLEEKLICNDTGHVIANVSPRYYRTNDTQPLYGDSTPLQNEYGWKANYTIEKIIAEMISYEYNCQRR